MVSCAALIPARKWLDPTWLQVGLCEHVGFMLGLIDAYLAFFGHGFCTSLLKLFCSNISSFLIEGDPFLHMYAASIVKIFDTAIIVSVTILCLSMILDQTRFHSGSSY